MLAASLLVLALRWPHYAPLQRFESVRRWHGRLLAVLHPRAALP